MRVDYDSHYFVQIMRDWVIEEEFPAPDAYIYKEFRGLSQVRKSSWQYLAGLLWGTCFQRKERNFFMARPLSGAYDYVKSGWKILSEAGCYVPGMMKSDFGKECYLELNDNNVAKQNFGNTTALAMFGMPPIHTTSTLCMHLSTTKNQRRK